MGDGPRKPDRRDLLVAGLVALAAETVYLLTLAPTVTAEDSGELITAAYTLGVAHPPGFPLWCLLGKLFQFPVGSFAHSGGLETYAQMDAGVHELRELLAHQIALGWGRLDLAIAALL